MDLQEVYAYSRILAGSEDQEDRINSMRDMMVPEEHIYMDFPTETNRRCFQFWKMLKQIQKGDLLYLSGLESLGDGYREIEERWRILTRERKVDVVLLNMPAIDTRKGKTGYGSAVADAVQSMLDYVVDYERNIRMVRQREGVVRAKEKGIVFGRPQKMAPDFAKAYNLWKKKKIKADEAAKMCGLSRGAFYYRVRKMSGEKKDEKR